MTISDIARRLPGWFFKGVPPQGDAMSSLLSAYRIFAGMMILPYGFGKIRGYDALAQNFFNNPVGLGNVLSLWICIFQQVFCAALLILGLQSRFAAFMLFTNMLVATQVHYFDPFVPTSSLPIVYMGMYAFLTLSGGGKFSADSLIFRRGSCGEPGYANVGCGLRAALMAAAALLSWFAVAKSQLLGIAGGYAALALICIMYGIAIYGFCPFRYMTGKLLSRR